MKQMLTTRGNDKKIIALSTAGMGVNQISGFFKDQGVTLAPKDAQSVIDRSKTHHVTKAIPNKAFNEALKAQKQVQASNDIGDNVVLA